MPVLDSNCHPKHCINVLFIKYSNLDVISTSLTVFFFFFFTFNNQSKILRLETFFVEEDDAFISHFQTEDKRSVCSSETQTRFFPRRPLKWTTKATYRLWIACIVLKLLWLPLGASLMQFSNICKGEAHRWDQLEVTHKRPCCSVFDHKRSVIGHLMIILKKTGPQWPAVQCPSS